MCTSSERTVCTRPGLGLFQLPQPLIVCVSFRTSVCGCCCPTSLPRNVFLRRLHRPLMRPWFPINLSLTRFPLTFSVFQICHPFDCVTPRFVLHPAAPCILRFRLMDFNTLPALFISLLTPGDGCPRALLLSYSFPQHSYLHSYCLCTFKITFCYPVAPSFLFASL